MYMVIDKNNNTKWAVSDDFNTFIGMCKYLKKNIQEAENLMVVWNSGDMTKEKDFSEFCAIQEI